MNLRAIDLNLLTVLDALLDEAHVSRAAQRIGMSQPAASSALERCRHLFQDRLLERAPSGMRLTPKALALREPLKQVLSGALQLVQPQATPVAQLQQTVRLLMADQPAMALAAHLHKELTSSAPGITLVIEPWQGAISALERLARGEIDLAGSVFPVLDPMFRRRLLSQEHYAVAMRHDHPAAQGFDLDRWLQYPHILVSSQGSTHGTLDESLHAIGRSRQVALVVPSFMMVPPLLERTDLMALLPTSCLPQSQAARRAWAVFEPPVPVEGFSLHMAWHERRDGDAAVEHVLNLAMTHFNAQRLNNPG